MVEGKGRVWVHAGAEVVYSIHDYLVGLLVTAPWDLS